MIGGCSLRSASGRWILLATLLASSTAFLMGTAVSVALPTIQSHFNTSITGIQWVVNAQLLALASLLLVGGSLGDHLGRKRVFLSGIVLFAVGALLSGLAAKSIGLLITFQAVQGIGAALMIPQSLAIINACFVEHERGQAIGLWAGLSGGIAALGPWLGGWVVETFGWQAVFLMALPLLALTLIVTLVFVPENRDPDARRLDWFGAVFILLGLLGIAYGLIVGPVSGWGTETVLISLIGGIIAIIAFIIIELRIAEPLVPLQMLKKPLVAGANAVTLFLYFALNGVIFFLVLRLQQVHGYSPTTAGLSMLPPIVIITFLAAPAGALADRIGPRLQMILGPTIVAAGMALLAVGGPDAGYVRNFMPGLILFGLGMALAIAPLTKSALAVDPQLSGAASGFNNSVSRIAALLAIAALGAIVLSTFSARLSDTLTSSGLTQENQGQILAQSDKLGGIDIPDNFDRNAQESAGLAIRESFVYGFRWAMVVCAVLALSGAFISFFSIHSPPHSRSPDSTNNRT
jgi:EmrB/QacA subfamily drug resistance transporter